MTHAIAPRSARTLAQARPTMSCIHLVIYIYFTQSTDIENFCGLLFIMLPRYTLYFSICMMHTVSQEYTSGCGYTGGKEVALLLLK